MVEECAFAAAAPSKNYGGLSFWYGKSYTLEDHPVSVLGYKISYLYRVFHLGKVEEQGGEEEVEHDHQKENCSLFEHISDSSLGRHLAGAGKTCILPFPLSAT